MIIETTRFGKMEIQEEKIITMKKGILGFEEFLRYTLISMDDQNPFFYFQSLEDGDLAFIVIDPFLIKRDYEVKIEDDELAVLEIDQAEDVFLLAIVTVREEPLTITANLRAPLVINRRKLSALQVILPDPALPLRWVIGENKADIDHHALKDPARERFDLCHFEQRP